MNYNFSFYQINKNTEALEQEFRFLAAHALRMIPRDARTNRDILEQCSARIEEARNILSRKASIDKIAVRQTHFLFEAVQLTYRRVINLAAAANHIGWEDNEQVKQVWEMLRAAQAQYRILTECLNSMTGLPVSLTLNEPLDSVAKPGDIYEKELALQSESLKLLEKAVETCSEEQDLVDKLAFVRKQLIQSKRQIKKQVTSQTAAAAEPALTPVG